MEGDEAVRFDVATQQSREGTPNPLRTEDTSCFVGRLWIQADWSKQTWRLRAMLGKHDASHRSGAAWPTKGMLDACEWPDRHESPSEHIRFVEFKRVGGKPPPGQES